MELNVGLLLNKIFYMYYRYLFSIEIMQHVLYDKQSQG